MTTLTFLKSLCAAVCLSGAMGAAATPYDPLSGSGTVSRTSTSLSCATLMAPAGDIIHQAGIGREVMPVEIDLARVRRERVKGLMSLGQPLKSFRDSQIDFAAAQTDTAYLDTLGPIVKPGRE